VFYLNFENNKFYLFYILGVERSGKKIVIKKTLKRGSKLN